jgi:hypothetical protein
MNLERTLLALALAAPVSLACSGINTPIYLNAPMPLLEVMDKIPRITNSVTLKYRKPNMGEQTQLDAQKKALGFDVPWVSRDKIHLEVLFTVKNLDTDTGTFDVLVDGANQYMKYDETVVAAALGQGKNDQPMYLPLISLHPQLPMMLGPGSSYSGVVREDDFVEAEKDLDAMGRWMAPFAEVLINRSEIEATFPPPNGLEMVPPNVVTPALVEVDVTLTADKHMTCEWMVRVRDDDDRLWHVQGDPHFNPQPTLFQPMLAPKTP